jgi:DNA-binding response OmpR family regulator
LATVLLVEDDAAIADLYALKLRLDGHAVSVARDSDSGAGAFRRERPEVVCVDVRLPDGEGRELAQRLAAEGARVILLTNDEDGVAYPPAGVALALLKARTRPSQLSAAVGDLVAARPAHAAVVPVLDDQR